MKMLILEVGTDCRNVEETEGRLELVVRTNTMLVLLEKYDTFNQLGQVTLGKETYVYSKIRMTTHDDLLDNWTVELKLLNSDTVK